MEDARQSSSMEEKKFSVGEGVDGRLLRRCDATNGRATDHPADGDDDNEEDFAVKIRDKRPYSSNYENNDLSNQSLAKQKRPLISCTNQQQEDAELESARAEMGEVRQENERLKMYLDRILNSCKTLQMQCANVVQQEAHKSAETISDSINDHDQEMEAPDDDQLVSLSLGRFSRHSKNKSKKSVLFSSNKEEEQGLSLALDCRSEASNKSGAENESAATNLRPAHSLDQEPKEEEAGETWSPGKSNKTMTRSGDDEVLQQNEIKKARVSVRARCDTPTMNDGCRWRKYGQKIAKGNPCPRAYYRCTVAPSCPVRKQVQRCLEDMTVLITTYEGTHNHPLTVSATAMASTTCAAVSMLLSGSSASTRPDGGSCSDMTSTAGLPVLPNNDNNNLHGLSFFLSSDDLHRSKQIYPPNSFSPLHPTITLDLTNPTPSSSSCSSSHFSNSSTRFASNYYTSSSSAPRSLNFTNASSESCSSIGTAGTHQQPCNQSRCTLNLGRQSIAEKICESSYMQENIPDYLNIPPRHHQQHLLSADRIAAATKAITANPSFQSALAAALKSIIGANHHQVSNSTSGDYKSNNPVMWASRYSETAVKGSGGCLNKSSSAGRGKFDL